MTRKSRIIAFGLVAAAAMASPSTARAQSARVDENVEKAERYEARAMDQIENRNRWEQAAWNLRRAGGLRPIGDPERSQSFAMAARLSYYVGDAIQSMQDFERAANAALYTGDLVGAADLFTDAAWVAGRAGERQTMERITAQVRALASAPNFGTENRGNVLGRLSGGEVRAPSFAAAGAGR